ncbi:MAG TPA: helix-turn-helix domain-containing protein [Thermoanaerobaculia bacterium]|nr:helix-turn-helix domain-containing protein [Thermoanaerobaculia bacterium]
MRNAHLVSDIQRDYPQIYLACHVDHVTARSTRWRLSSRDSSILSHLDRQRPMSPRQLAGHLGVASSTLSATIARLERLGYLASDAAESDRRRRELRLTERGAEAMASTSVLDAGKLTKLLERLSGRERDEAARGLELLARAARSLMKERKR